MISRLTRLRAELRARVRRGKKKDFRGKRKKGGRGHGHQRLAALDRCFLVRPRQEGKRRSERKKGREKEKEKREVRRGGRPTCLLRFPRAVRRGDANEKKRKSKRRDDLRVLRFSFIIILPALLRPAKGHRGKRGGYRSRHLVDSSPWSIAPAIPRDCREKGGELSEKKKGRKRSPEGGVAGPLLSCDCPL